MTKEKETIKMESQMVKGLFIIGFVALGGVGIYIWYKKKEPKHVVITEVGNAEVSTSAMQLYQPIIEPKKESYELKTIAEMRNERMHPREGKEEL